MNAPADLHSPVAHRARQVLRALLDGDALPEADCAPATLGPWAEAVQALLAANAVEGVPGVHRAFVALARHDPSLIHLLAGPQEGFKTLWTVAELYAADFAPPRFLVPDLLPTGLTILAGRPKAGKSWLALQLATAVGAGGSVLGLPAVQGKVLYLALEDTPRRLKDRLLKQGAPADAAVTFATVWEPLTGAGLVELMVAATRGYTLIVVDTLARAMGRADPLDAADMTLLLGGLHQLAARYELALLLVDHHRKPGHPVADPIDDILGSTAKAGVIDAALGLYKQRENQEATLRVTGRDLAERELALRWDARRFMWEAQGEAEEVERTQRQQEVLDALALLGRAQLRDLADATGQERANLFRRLQTLVKTGAVRRSEEHGQVFYACA